ncbi:PAS domain S-box protein [Arcticibacter tournemirensis]|uniref:Sensory/regulatory protein RpfC n=1 Tax=Arcticibacter tournemirensis TaxID=699437 RepID=A0A4Q0MF93_9SPHI|nr:PAS domain S-box protein [Arcticibacter tournemirensis]RXF72150.1 PAS domain S-box protein [Arcticibacter tournemirensis]
MISPVSPNEKARLKALKSYHILDSLPEKEFDRFTELASLICGTSISLISLIDENRQWFKSKIGIDVSETSRDVAFCRYTILEKAIMEVKDATSDERFKDNPFVTGDPKIRFYAGYPIIDTAGFALGTLCVIDSVPGQLSEGQARALQLLAGEIADAIVERKEKEDQKHFEKLFNLSNDLIGVAGSDRFFKRLNPAFTTVLGWDEKTLLSAPIAEFIHPDDLEMSRAHLAKLSSENFAVNFTNRFRTSGGSYLTLHWVCSTDSTSGDIYAVARDISDEKQRERRLMISENKFRAFFENSQGLMCTHDLEGKLLTVNQAGAGLLGYTPEELTGKTLYSIIPDGQQDALTGYLEKIHAEGKANGLMHTLHKDGTVRIWVFNNVLEKSEDGGLYVIANAIDITRRHRLEADLKRANDMLEQTSKIANVGGWEVDLVTEKIFWSEQTKAIHEVDADFEPDLSSAISFYRAGSDRVKITDAVNRAVRDGLPWDLELRLITSRGREIWVRALGNPEFDGNVCKRLYGTFQDIDEKKTIEIENTRLRKLFNDVLQAASEVSIIATDPEGIITVFNTGAEHLTGYSAVEMIGKQNPAILHLASEMKERSEELSRAHGSDIFGFRTFIHNSELYGSDQNEWTYVRKDGSQFTVSLVVTTMKDDYNQVVGYLGIATDIDQQKKAELALNMEKSRLSAFVEHAPAAVAMFDADIHYIAVSNRWIEEYHLQGREVVGKSHYEVFPNISDEWKELHKRCLNGEVLKNNEDVWKPEGWNHDQHLKWEVRPWYQLDGTVGGIMMFTQDITETCRQREELRKAKLLAEQASVAKSEFLANMSHEIRTPLNGIIGFTDLVLKTSLNDTQHQYLSIVNQSGSALLGIINDILDFSKIEAGKLDLDISECDLYELSSQAADIISYQVQKKGVEMLLDISSDLPRFIETDSVRLKQVLINLLSNAVKFTEKGEIELKIKAIESNTNTTSFRFEVRDTGIGIKPERQERIFEAFLQEDVSTTKKYGGTGLGLTISNRLLGLMDSRLQLKSTPGLGSTFYFDITVPARRGEPINWAGIDQIKNVLIVDDNDNNRIILKQMLLLKQISTEEARNGIEAINRLANGERFDVIIMDYHMPYMDGLETIKKIRNHFSESEEQALILLHSSSDDGTLIKGCEELHISNRLIKPVKTQELYNAMSRLFTVGNGDQQGSIDEPQVVVNHGLLKVLVAEDNTVNMLLAKTVIGRIAPESVVIEAKNGAEAVRLCTEELPDIIFMDIQMPEMNGYEATAKIRKLFPEASVPIIALTAGNVKGEKEKCLDAGMNDFIAKPFVEETLIPIFNHWLGANRSPQINEIIIQMENSRHFNMDTIREYVSDDAEIIRELLRLTINELRNSRSDLESLLIHPNLSKLNQTGHRLYGTTVSAGMDQLACIARKIEHLTKVEGDTIGNIIRDAVEEIDLVVELIKNEI